MRKKYFFVSAGLIFTLFIWWFFFKQPHWQKLPTSKGEELSWSQPEACKVKDFNLLYHTPGPSGGAATWSPTDKNIIIYSKWDENKIKQLYRRNLENNKEECLTCQNIPGGPSVKVHKGWPSFDATGRFLIFQAAMETHQGKKWGKWLTEPGAGWYQDIWVWNMEKNKRWNLTNYPPDEVHGVLVPKLSHNGKKLSWAELYRGSGWASFLSILGISQKGPIWGYWQISIADFIVDEKGVRLENIKHYQPSKATFYELQDWSPDDKTIIFATDIGRDTPYKEDIWFLDVASGKATPFANNTANNWDEHATLTQSGQKIVYMSSKCCNWNPYDWKSLKTELYLSDLDGQNEVQLTHFNDPGYLESQVDKGRAIAVKGVFNQTGDKMLLEQLLIPKDKDATQRETNHWLITFQGECGKL